MRSCYTGLLLYLMIPKKKILKKAEREIRGSMQKEKKKRLNYMIKLAVLNTTNVYATFQIALIIIIITLLSVLKFNVVFFHVVKQQLCSSTEKKQTLVI